MQLKQLLNDDDAVSPVIGVILMVAITVILAAVIGTFVLGLGEQVQTTAPNAQFNFNYDSAGADNLTITHQGGDGITGEEVFLSGDVTKTDDNSGGDMSWADQAGKTGTVRAGSKVIVGNYDNDDTVDYDWADNNGEGASVDVVWQDTDSDQSSTLRSWTQD